MEYSPLNPVIWLIFGGFIAVIYITVKIYHMKYPDYPDKGTKK